jgi:hypothetical protein
MSKIVLSEVLISVKNPIVQTLLLDRAKKGLIEYDEMLKTDNDRDCIKDLLEELLDALMYCKQAEMEFDIDTYRLMFMMVLSMVEGIVEMKDGLIEE